MCPSAPDRHPVLSVVGAAILRGGRCLATRRSAVMSMPRLWEFPGGKVEDGETPQEALRRELREELAIQVEVEELLASGEATVDRRTIRLDVYRATPLTDAEPHPHEHDAIGWFTADELDQLEWPDADLPAVAAVRELLRSPGRPR